MPTKTAEKTITIERAADDDGNLHQHIPAEEIRRIINEQYVGREIVISLQGRRQNEVDPITECGMSAYWVNSRQSAPELVRFWVIPPQE